MGAWGPTIFADDDAADARLSFQSHLAEAQDVRAATDAIVASTGASFERPENETAFWLGLAVTQWQKGWLDPRVLENALRVIDDGSDLAKWEGRSAAARARVLASCRTQLVSPLPPPRPFPRRPKPWPVQLADFQPGEIIGRRLPNGKVAVMKVIGFRRVTDVKVLAPQVRLLKWCGDAMPADDVATTLEPLWYLLSPNGVTAYCVLILTMRRGAALDAASFVRPGIVVDVSKERTKLPGTSIDSWSRKGVGLDDLLNCALQRWWDDPTLPANARLPWFQDAAARG